MGRLAGAIVAAVLGSTGLAVVSTTVFIPVAMAQAITPVTDVEVLIRMIDKTDPATATKIREKFDEIDKSERSPDDKINAKIAAIERVVQKLKKLRDSTLVGDDGRGILDKSVWIAKTLAVVILRQYRESIGGITAEEAAGSVRGLDFDDAWVEGDSSNYSSRFLIDEFQQLKLELKEQRRREAGLDTKDLPPAEDAPPGSGYDTDSSAYGYGDWDWSFALHSRTIFGEIEAGADEDDIWDSALGVTGDFGPVTITLDQSWMERDFESGGSADFSTLTGAGRIDMSNFFNTGSLSHELKFGAAVTAAVQDGEIDFSGGGGQDFDMLRLGGDGWWELDLGNGVAPMIGLSAGYIDLDNGFGVGDLSGYYVRPVVGLNLTKGFDFCLDAGLVDIGGDGPDTDYREIGAALTLDWTALGFGLFDFVKSSKTSLDVHYGEFDLGAGAKNSQFMFGIGSTWKFGGSAAAGSDAGYERSYYDSIDGCNGGGALLPLTDIRLKMGF